MLNISNESNIWNEKFHTKTTSNTITVDGFSSTIAVIGEPLIETQNLQEPQNIQTPVIETQNHSELIIPIPPTSCISNTVRITIMSGCILILIYIFTRFK